MLSLSWGLQDRARGGSLGFRGDKAAPDPPIRASERDESRSTAGGDICRGSCSCFVESESGACFDVRRLARFPSILSTRA